MSRKKKSLLELIDFRKALTHWVSENANILRKQFQPVLKAEELLPAAALDAWVHRKTFTAIHKTQLVHEFYCEPFGRDIHGYVYTDLDGTEIQNVIAQVE